MMIHILFIEALMHCGSDCEVDWAFYMSRAGGLSNLSVFKDQAGLLKLNSFWPDGV